MALMTSTILILPLDLIKTHLLPYVSLSGIVILARCLSHRCSQYFAPLYCIVPQEESSYACDIVSSPSSVESASIGGQCQLHLTLPSDYTAYFQCDEAISHFVRSTSIQVSIISCGQGVTSQGLRALLKSQFDIIELITYMRRSNDRRPYAALLAIHNNKEVKWKRILRRMCNVKVLHISAPFHSPRLFQTLSRHSSALTDLNVSHSDICDEILEGLMRAPYSLKRLDVGSTLITTIPLSNFIVWRGEDLQHLGMQELMLEEAAFAHCIPSLSSLTSIDISRNDWVTDVTISAIANSSTDLQSIDMRRCPSISARSVKDIVSNCKHLDRIEMSHVAEGIDDVFDLLASKMEHKCSVINATQCSYLTDAPLLRLLDPLSPSPSFCLKELEVSGCSLLTDASLSAISNCGAHLRKLSLKSCRKMTDACLESIVSSCYNMREIDMSYCALITHASVSVMFQRCKSLVAISAHGCREIAYDQTAAYISHTKYLEKFLISNWSSAHVSSRDFKGCIYLHELCLQNLKDLTDAGVHSILSDVRSLRQVIIQECENLTSNLFIDLILPEGYQLRSLMFILCPKMKRDAPVVAQFRTTHPNVEVAPCV